MEEQHLLVTGVLGIFIIVSLILFVNSNPTAAISYTRADQPYATKQYPCSSLKGYCFDEATSSPCPFRNDGWCPKSCECRLY